MSVIVAYIVFSVSGFFLATVIGTAISAMKGNANPHFASTGFFIVSWLILGLPCYFAGDYIRVHGNESFSLLILGIVLPLGIMIGLSNRA